MLIWFEMLSLISRKYEDLSLLFGLREHGLIALQETGIQEPKPVVLAPQSRRLRDELLKVNYSTACYLQNELDRHTQTGHCIVLCEGMRIWPSDNNQTILRWFMICNIYLDIGKPPQKLRTHIIDNDILSIYSPSLGTKIIFKGSPPIYTLKWCVHMLGNTTLICEE